MSDNLPKMGKLNIVNKSGEDEDMLLYIENCWWNG